MYLCLDCNSVFSCPKKIVEKHGLDYPPYEEFYGCPKCGGTYVGTIECDSCGNYVTNDYIETIDGSIYCENCYSIKNVEDLN